MIVTGLQGAPLVGRYLARRGGGGLAGADLLNTEVSMSQEAIAAGLAPSGGSSTEQSNYNRDVAKFMEDLRIAQVRFQDSRRAALLASAPLKECWNNALYYELRSSLVWKYNYAQTGRWQEVLASLKAVQRGSNSTKRSTDVTGLSDDLWAEMCAHADINSGLDASGRKCIQQYTMGSTQWCIFMPGGDIYRVGAPITTRNYAGGYSAAWNVLFYGANPQAPAPNYATPSANNNTTILTNFGLTGFDQYLMGVEATKFLARLANDCPRVPETQYWIGRLAPLTASRVTQSQLDAAGRAVQYSNTFFRTGENIGLLKASAAAGGQSAAEQEAARQEAAGALGGTTGSVLFWGVLLVGGGAVAYWLLKKPKAKSNGGAQ